MDRLALFDPPTDDVIQALVAAIESKEGSLDSAQLGLTLAYQKQAELYEAADPLDVAQRTESIRNAEQQLANARETLASAVLVAPIDGTIATLNIEPGDSVGASTTVAVVTNTEQITIELTVSESDLPGLSVGQLGLADFSALPDNQYVVQILSVSTLPNSAQGVVTYPVTARVLGPSDLASLEGGPQAVAAVLAALGTDATGGAATFAAPPDGAGAGDAPGQGRPQGGQGNQAGALREFITQDADGTLRLRDGVEIPEGFELPEGVTINAAERSSSAADFSGRAGRTREIGIRRAVGARSKDILIQFVTEALALCIGGGAIGIAIGLGVATFLDGRMIAGTEMATIIQTWSVFVAFAVAAGIGMAAGTYPALRASRLDPIDALRAD